MDFKNSLIKIELAAKWLEVTPKTIYNWIEEGALEMPEKGMVRRGDVEKVHKDKILKRSDRARLLAFGIIRDKNGRFIKLEKDEN